MNKTAEQYRAELEAKYSPKDVALKMANVVKERQNNGGDVSMFPRWMRN